MRRKKKDEGKTLMASCEFTPRFSDVDSMNIVWHGSYPLYFEDAREAFGRKYNLGYLTIFHNGYYAPLVEMNYEFKSPAVYGMQCRVDITYHATEAAKIVFTYEIRNCANEELLATGRTVQVFMDREYQLVWLNPPFYQKWKEANGLN